MVLYKKKTSQLVRYIFGAIVFILGLTLAFGDVYGIQMPYSQNSSQSYSDHIAKKTQDESTTDTTIVIGTDFNDNQTGGTDTVPTSVPEPTTIILLASGLGIMGLSKKKRK